MTNTTLGRVLVVDDEIQLMEALVEALTAQGYEAAGFSTGEAALEALQTEEFDLLLTDLMMPGLDGIALLKAGLMIDPHLVGILMTGQGTVPTAVEAMKTGAFDYLLKPFKMVDVLPVLARAREVRRLRIENIQLRETVAIYNLSQTIAFSLDSKPVLENTADAALQQAEADEVSIMLFAPESQQLYIAVVRGKEREHLLGQRVSLQEGIASWVARQSEPLILNGEVSDPRFAPLWPRTEIRSAISMPMLAAGRLVGVLNVNRLQGRRPFTTGQVKALSILTGTAAAALENESLYTALQEREKRFRSLIENAPDGITVVDTKGTVRYVGPSIERILGYSQAEALGRAALEYVHSEDRSRLLRQLARLTRKSGQALVQYRFKHKDGSWLWLESAISNLITEPSVEAIVFNYRDITERKQAEEKLQLSDEIFQRVYALVIVANSQGRITYVSPATKAILGYEPEELLGDHWWDLTRSTPTEVQREKEYVGRAARGEGPIAPEAYERPLLDRQGNTHWISWVDAAGPGSTLIGVGHDITERKQTQESIQHQLQKLRGLRAIDAVISNATDLKWSLATILKEIVSQLGVSAAAILLFNRLMLTLEYAAGDGFNSSAIRQTHLRMGQDFAGRAALERRVVHVSNLEQAASDFARAELLKGEAFVSYFGVPLIIKGELKGVLEIFHRTELYPDREWLDFLETLAGQAAIAIDNGQLFEHLQRSKNELSLAYDATIEGWSRAMDLRDKETEGHSQRVTELTLRLARAAGMTEVELVHVRRGALLHDMGKMGIPDAILLKPGKLTDEEWDIMRKHPQYAYDMLSPIVYLRPALDIPYCHHEKWDGTGYPRGLQGENIPLAARLFAVADVWDALTSDRPYRQRWSKEKTLDYLREQAGSHFDPKAIEWFLQVVRE